jgi:serine protease inhibitor
MRKLLFLLISAILLVPTLSGCGPKDVTASSDKITDPNVTVNEMSAFAGNNGDFAFDLYRELKGKDGNLLFSPYSLSAVLAMTFAAPGRDRKGNGGTRFTSLCRRNGFIRPSTI